jgi:hypothetical protein
LDVDGAGLLFSQTEYLKRFNTVGKSVAVDVIDSPVAKYCEQEPECEFKKIDSTSSEFANFMKDNSFDLVFIDGDHSYEGVSKDFETSKNSGSIFVFHDIASIVCPGVVQFWKEMKQREGYTFF